MSDFSRCANCNCQLRLDCKRFSISGVGFTTLFRPERRKDGVVWCSVFMARYRNKERLANG